MKTKEEINKKIKTLNNEILELNELIHHEVRGITNRNIEGVIWREIEDGTFYHYNIIFGIRYVCPREGCFGCDGHIIRWSKQFRLCIFQYREMFARLVVIINISVFLSSSIIKLDSKAGVLVYFLWII